MVENKIVDAYEISAAKVVMYLPYVSRNCSGAFFLRLFILFIFNIIFHALVNVYSFLCAPPPAPRFSSFLIFVAIESSYSSILCGFPHFRSQEMKKLRWLSQLLQKVMCPISLQLQSRCTIITTEVGMYRYALLLFIYMSILMWFWLYLNLYIKD